MENNRSKDIIEFLEIIGRLKHTVRRGWELRSIAEPECIAGHMYRMAIMTFLLDDKDLQLDRLKCMQLALVHDLAEAKVGDITPLCGVTPDEKHKLEDEAMKKISDLVGERGKYLYNLYKEYADLSSNEAKFVKDIDKFDMILQAFEYEKRDKKPESLQEFFDSTEGKFKHPMIKYLCEELYSQRSNYKNQYQNLTI